MNLNAVGSMGVAWCTVQQCSASVVLSSIVQVCCRAVQCKCDRLDRRIFALCDWWAVPRGHGAGCDM